MGLSLKSLAKVASPMSMIDSFFGGGPDRPDMGGINAASQRAQEYGYGAGNADLAFRQGVYGQQQPRMQELYNLASQVSNQQFGLSGGAQQFGQQQLQQYGNFMPNEYQMLADAYGGMHLGGADRTQLNQLITGGGGLNTADRLGAMQGLARKAEDTAGADAAARAGGQVNDAYGMQARMMARYGGGDPRRLAPMAAQMANSQALAQVHASNTARQGVRDQGIGLRANAAGLGRSVAGAGMQGYGLSADLGNSAINAQNTGFMSALPYAQFQSGAYGTQLGAAGLAQQGTLGLGQLQTGMYKTEADAHGAGMAGLGQLAGTVGMLAFKSDRRLKSNIVLTGVHPLGVGIYEYDIDGRRERGVMADEVEKVLPEAVLTGADGYKLVNYAMLR